jgi:methyl halide transferase
MWELLDYEGVLVTLLFPVGEFQGGPPFATKPKTYQDLLLPLGFVCDFSEPVSQSFPARQGREHIAIWRKPTTAKSNL